LHSEPNCAAINQQKIPFSTNKLALLHLMDGMQSADVVQQYFAQMSTRADMAMNVFVGAVADLTLYSVRHIPQPREAMRTSDRAPLSRGPPSGRIPRPRAGASAIRHDGRWSAPGPAGKTRRQVFLLLGL
jgi:hypothetical protein